MWEPWHFTTYGPSRPVTGIAFKCACSFSILSLVVLHVFLEIGNHLLHYISCMVCQYSSCWDSSVGIATSHQLDGSSLIPSTARFFSSPDHPDQLWGHPASYPMATGGSFPGGGGEYSGGSVKLTTHLHLVPRSRMVELYLHSPICLHGIVLK
jgi:hypothetical protein